MLVEVYHHRYWDQLKDASIIIPTFATEEYIERTKGEKVPETRREIDERLLDADGKAIIQLNSEDWKTLSELATHQNQPLIISGNVNRKPWNYLENVKLVSIHAINLNDTEHKVTELGRLALKQLS